MKGEEVGNVIDEGAHALVEDTNSMDKVRERVVLALMPPLWTDFGHFEPGRRVMPYSAR